MADWSEHSLDYLRRNWGKMPTAKIAQAIGKTKSSAIGKAHRLGLPNLGNPVGKRNAASTPTERVPYARRDESGKPKVSTKPRRLPETFRGAASSSTLARATPTKREPEPILPRPRALPTQASTGEPKPFNKLLSGECKWILGPTVPGRADEALACAQPIASIGRPWCAAHAERARGKVAADTGNLENIEKPAAAEAA
jgi:hypothetical protein